MDFAIQPKDKTFLDTISLWRGKADPKVVIDYGIHVAVTNLTEDLVKEIPKVLEAGLKLQTLHAIQKGGSHER